MRRPYFSGFLEIVSFVWITSNKKGEGFYRNNLFPIVNEQTIDRPADRSTRRSPSLPDPLTLNGPPLSRCRRHRRRYQFDVLMLEFFQHQTECGSHRWLCWYSIKMLLKCL